MDHAHSIKALQGACVVTGGVGLLIVAALVTPAAALLDLFVDVARWPLDGGQGVDTDAARLLAAISGGVLAGWAAMTWLVVTRVYVRDPAIGATVILPGFAVWFVVDGLGSILAGAGVNLLLNTPFLLLFAVPIMLERRRRRAVAA
jgi:hypothetical protein